MNVLALYAAATLYVQARRRGDLEACNVYTAAAQKISPWWFEVLVGPHQDDDTESKTVAGVGSPTVFVRP